MTSVTLVSSLFIGCDVFSETTPECFARPSASEEYYGMVFWTAGQRIDPTSNSTFVWRVRSTDSHTDRLSVMTYSHWEPGQPSYWRQDEHCMHFSSKLAYQWNDCPCRSTLCSVCEIDMRTDWSQQTYTPSWNRGYMCNLLHAIYCMQFVAGVLK